MKRLSVIGILVIVSIFFIATNVYANVSEKIVLSSDKKEYVKDDQVIITAKISDLVSDNGIIALSGVLSYDKNNLEFVKISGLGQWSNPSYNKDNGKFVVDRSELTKANEDVFQVLFKVKSEKASNINISLTNVEVSGGDGVYNLENASKSVKIVAVSNKDDDNTSNSDSDKDNNDSNNNENSNENNNQDNNDGNINNNDNNNSNNNDSNVNNNDNNSNNNNSVNNNIVDNSITTNNNNSINTQTQTNNRAPKNIVTNTLPKENLPKAGENNNIIKFIILGISISIISYIKFKKVNYKL